MIESDIVTRGTNHGDSIAVNGVCLTASISRPIHLQPTYRWRPWRVLHWASLKPGTPVNLERSVTPPLAWWTIVQGHVDARGKLLGVEDHGESWTVRFGYPPEIARYLVFKGSVAVEGISLTIAGD